MSKGKKNDHIFHNAAMDHLVSYYQDKFAKENLPAIKHVIGWSDNCPPQYKCSANFGKIANFSDRHPGVHLSHRFAEKYRFKGVWDAVGKVSDAFFCCLEMFASWHMLCAFSLFQQFGALKCCCVFAFFNLHSGVEALHSHG